MHDRVNLVFLEYLIINFGALKTLGIYIYIDNLHFTIRAVVMAYKYKMKNSLVKK